MKFTMTKIAAAAALAFASTGAMAGIGDGPVSSGGVFDMYSQLGYDQATPVLAPAGSGTTGSDPTISAFVNQDAGTWGVASTTPFFGVPWTASNGHLITVAGDYALDTATGSVAAAAPDFGGTNDQMMHFTVGANQVAGTIDFSWGGNNGIRVVNVWNVNANGSLTAVYAPGMENGPFNGFNASFNLTGPNLITPVPEASTYGMMLAGLGLVGFAVRRRKMVA